MLYYKCLFGSYPVNKIWLNNVYLWFTAELWVSK